jgi:hypothetical protein
MTQGLPRGTVISLDSAGGAVEVAIEIGRWVRKRGYETMVRSGSQRDSACPLIWFAGTQRHLGHKAQLGFHSARRGLWPDRHEPGNVKMRGYLTELGDVSPELIKLVRRLIRIGSPISTATQRLRRG